MAAKQTATAGSSNATSPAASPASTQPGLIVGATNDPLEYEADFVADKIMRMPDMPLIQRCACEEEKINRKPISSNVTPFIQAKSEQAGYASNNVTSGINASRGSGSAMDTSTRSFMESRFGADFSNVNIHTDNHSIQLNRELNAHAFTTGNDVYFNQGKYAPHSDSGKHLLAHELTHVIQQSKNSNSTNIMKKGIKRPPARRDCPVRPNDYIRLVVVNQEQPQTVSIFWNYSNSVETDVCSTGKGDCCIPDNSGNAAVGCTEARSRQSGSNCTPIGLHTVTNNIKRASSSGVNFWTQFNDPRSIALHQYDENKNDVTGEPLSHGCVRLKVDMAKRIYCGSISNLTRVEVRGFSRPRCSDPNLQQQWRNDFGRAFGKIDGDEFANETAKERRQRLSSRRTARRELMDYLPSERGRMGEDDLDDMLNTLYEDGLSSEELNTKIPKCGGVSNLDTETERAHLAPAFQLLPDWVSKFSSRITQQAPENYNSEFVNEVRLKMGIARNYAGAVSSLVELAKTLWNDSHGSASAKKISLDDRTLYWTRILAIRELTEWYPVFPMNSSKRSSLIKKFELASRGLDVTAFEPGIEDAKKILITGFDPFGMDTETYQVGNPSGAVVLALDGTTITDGKCSAQIRGAVFPVRYRDFNEQIVENYVRNFLSGDNEADMIMTISRGSNKFELEQWAARARAGYEDNNAQTSSRSELDRSLRSQYGKRGLKNEFIESTLPFAEMTGKKAAMVDHTYSGHTPGGTLVNQDTNATPTPDTIADKGSGSNFLSNEIFYRVRLLELSKGSSIPMGHLHIPASKPGNYFKIIDRVRSILKNSLKSLCS